MTPQELRQLLQENGIRPVHDRGQHFLLDMSVIDKMVAAAGVAKGDCVLEIGPGPGVLTEKILAAGAELVAVEIDLKLQNLLERRFGENENFHLLRGDALDFSNSELLKHFSDDRGSRVPSPGVGLGMTGNERSATQKLSNAETASYKLLANLPYAITSAVLQKFLLEAPIAASLTVMVQREVADRVLAGAGEMSSPAVLVQTYAAASRVVNVPAGAFLPPPKVDSAVIHIARKSDAELAKFFEGTSVDAYFAVVRAAFSAKRKQLKNTLAAVESDENRLNAAFLSAKIDPKARPEELTVAHWRALAIALAR